MGDFVKWGLLIVGLVAVIALIVALPVWEYLDTTELGTAVGSLVTYVGDFFRSARGLINNFTTPFGAGALTAVITFKLTKPFVTRAIKMLVGIYHFIFK